MTVEIHGDVASLVEFLEQSENIKGNFLSFYSLFFASVIALRL